MASHLFIESLSLSVYPSVSLFVCLSNWMCLNRTSQATRVVVVVVAGSEQEQKDKEQEQETGKRVKKMVIIMKTTIIIMQRARAFTGAVRPFGWPLFKFKR